MRTWNDWEEIHQPFELGHWQERGGIEWCDSDEYKPHWEEIFEFIQPHGKLLDIGCGPRPPFGHGSTAIDSLIDRYRRIVPDEWWDGIKAYVHPAERLLPQLAGRFDTVMCWNCIDHTIGWDQILVNIATYGREGTTYAIATDFHPPMPGHPGFEYDAFMAELDKLFCIVRQRENFKERHLAMVLEAA